MKFLRNMTLIEWMIIFTIVAILLALAAGLPAQVRERESFMASCTSREPQYECEFKWKQMHPDPIVVYAPFNK